MVRWRAISPTHDRLVFYVESHGSSSHLSPEISINGYPTSLHHPARGMSFWSALVFANTLSEMEGLRPRYDLRKVVFDPQTEAALGNLRHFRGVLRIDRNANGYRLPTESEWEVAARGGYYNSHFRAELPLGAPRPEPGVIADYGWFSDEPKFRNRPQRVGTKKGTVVLDKNSRLLGRLYDFLENVAEWTEDAFTCDPPGSQNLFTPTDPLNVGTVNSARTIKGCCCSLNACQIGPEYRNREDPNNPDRYNVGIRLVKPLQ